MELQDMGKAATQKKAGQPAASAERPPNQEDVAGGVEQEARGAQHALPQPLHPQAQQPRHHSRLLQGQEGGVRTEQRPRHGVILHPGSGGRGRQRRWWRQQQAARCEAMRSTAALPRTVMLSLPVWRRHGAPMCQTCQ